MMQSKLFYGLGLLLLLSLFNTANGFTKGWRPTTIPTRTMTRQQQQQQGRIRCYQEASLKFSKVFYEDFEEFEEFEEEPIISTAEEDTAIGKALQERFQQVGTEEQAATTVGKDPIMGGGDTAEDMLEFVRKLSSGGGRKKEEETEEPKEWARVHDNLKGGCVLIANPEKFCSGWSGASEPPSPSLLAKFGLTHALPQDLGADRRADLLPVLVLTDRNFLKGSQAVLLNRRTGYLIGDLDNRAAVGSANEDTGEEPQKPPQLAAFMIQPLWFGGTSADSGGLDMLHFCSAVQGSTKLTDDGLYWGGDPEQAQDAMKDPSLPKPLSGFDFKFFVQCTKWLPTQLEQEVKDGTWIVASVSKEVLFKSRNRMGTRKGKPLWTEVMELLGGEYKKIRDQLYEEEENNNNNS